MFLRELSFLFLSSCFLVFALPEGPAERSPGAERELSDCSAFRVLRDAAVLIMQIQIAVHTKDARELQYDYACND